MSDKKKSELPETPECSTQNDRTSGLFTDPEPWGEEVNGDQLISELVAIIKKYVILSDESALAVSLWIINTYTFNLFPTLALLAILSPDKRCGKTTLLTLLVKLVWRAFPSSNITSASIFRIIERYEPTIIIDEGDTFLQNNNELRGIINSGHTRSTAYTVRCVGESHEPTRFSTWSPKVIALIGELHPTLHDRSIVVRLKRKMKNEKVERLRAHHDFEDLRRRIIRWVNDNG